MVSCKSSPLYGSFRKLLLNNLLITGMLGIRKQVCHHFIIWQQIMWSIWLLKKIKGWVGWSWGRWKVCWKLCKGWAEKRHASGIGMVTIGILNIQRWYGRLLLKLYFVSMVQKTGNLRWARKPFTIIWVRQKHLGVIIKFVYESSTPK